MIGSRSGMVGIVTVARRPISRRIIPSSVVPDVPWRRDEEQSWGIRYDDDRATAHAWCPIQAHRLMWWCVQSHSVRCSPAGSRVVDECGCGGVMASAKRVASVLLEAMPSWGRRAAGTARSYSRAVMGASGMFSLKIDCHAMRDAVSQVAWSGRPVVPGSLKLRAPQ